MSDAYSGKKNQHAGNHVGGKNPYSRNTPVAAQKLRVREVEAGEDGGGAECRACLTATVVAMADIEGKGIGEGRGESDGAALARGFHDAGFGVVKWAGVEVRGRFVNEVRRLALL